MAAQQFEIRKAVKAAKKARIALDGPAGSGKTFTALELAVGLAEGGKIGVLDTEKSSADLYADRYDFDTIKLTNFSPQNYIGALEAFAEAGYAVVIVDSWSHAWDGEGGALEMVDAAAARTKGNSYAGWREVTPLHNRMVGAILDYPGHVIVTMRSKMEYALEKDEKTGKTSPRKIGMAPVQRGGVEYEFDIVVDMDLEHNFIVSKTRLPVLDGKMIKCPTRKVGKGILDDLNSGAAPPAAETPAPQPEQAPAPAAEDAATAAPEGETGTPAWQWDPGIRESARQKMLSLGLEPATAEKQLKAVTSDEQMRELAAKIKAKAEQQKAAPAGEAATVGAEGAEAPAQETAQAAPDAATAPATGDGDLPPTSDAKTASEGATTAVPEGEDGADATAATAETLEEPAEDDEEDDEEDDPADDLNFDEPAEGGHAGQSLFGDSGSVSEKLRDATRLVEADQVPVDLRLVVADSAVLRQAIQTNLRVGPGTQEGLLAEMGRGAWEDLTKPERLALYWLAQERAEAGEG